MIRPDEGDSVRPMGADSRIELTVRLWSTGAGERFAEYLDRLTSLLPRHRVRSHAASTASRAAPASPTPCSSSPSGRNRHRRLPSRPGPSRLRRTRRSGHHPIADHRRSHPGRSGRAGDPPRTPSGPTMSPDMPDSIPVEGRPSPIHGMVRSPPARSAPASASASTPAARATRTAPTSSGWKATMASTAASTETTSCVGSTTAPHQMEFDGLELFALVDIEPDTELCFHYGEEWEHVD